MSDPTNFFPLDHILNPVNPQVPPVAPEVSTSQKATDLLAAAATSRKENLSSIAEAKKIALGGYDRLAIAQQGNNNLFNDNQYLMDSVTMTPADLSAKYGEQALGEQANITAARGRLEQEQGVERGTGQALGDTANAVGQGFVNSLGGLGALGAGAVSDRAGSFVSDKLNDFSEYAQSEQSAELNRVRQRNAIASELDQADNAAQFEKDKETDGNTVAGLKQFGRDFIDATARVVETDEALSDLAGQAVGSMVAAAPVGGAIGAAGKPIAKVLGSIGEKVIEKGSMSLAIGATEAGGAYTGTSQDIANMSDEELYNKSDKFKSMLESGSTVEEARDAVRNSAGLKAAAIVAPIAATTGLLVSKFEANPFAVPSLRTAAGNLVREAVEETPQGVAGQFAQNVAIQSTADRDRALMQDLGRAGGEGLIGGPLAAGATQAPGTVYRGTTQAVLGTLDTVLNMGAKVQERNAKASPVAQEKLIEAGTIESAKAESIADNLASLATEVASDEQQVELNNYLSRVVSVSRITPDEIATLPDIVQTNLPETNDRFQTMITAASVAASEGVDINDRFSAGLYVLDQLKNNQAVFESDLPAALQGLDRNAPEFEALDQYAQILNNIGQSKEFQQIAEMINSTMLEMNADAEITPQLVDNAVGLSRHNPAGVNPEVNDRILYQADQGDFELSPKERASLTMSASLVRAGREFYEALAALDAPTGTSTPTMEQVTEMVTRKSDDQTKPSLNEQMANIVEAITVDQPEMADLRATRLRNFAQHMQNKLTAMNMSFEQSGKPVYYDALMPDGTTFKKSETPMVAYANKENSIALAQQIYAEAKMASTLVNNVVTTFPDLSIKKIKEPFLSKGMRKQEPEAKAPVAKEVVPEVTAPVEAKASQKAPISISTDMFEFDEADAIQREPKNESVDPAPVENQVSEEPRAEVVKETPAPETVKEAETGTEVSETDVSGTDTEGTDTVVVDANAPTTVETLYPNLLTEGSNKNRFHDAFKLTATTSSRLVGEEAPMDFLKDTLSSRANLIAVAGGNVRYDFSDKDARTYKRLLDMTPKLLTTMKDRLRKRLLEPTKSDGVETTRIALLNDGNSDLTTWLSGRILNIVDSNEKGYNRVLTEQAVAAGMHWMLNAEERSYPMDAQEVAKITGLDEVEAAKYIDDFNHGVSLTEAKRGLAQLVRQFWGVQGNENIGEGYVEGIPEAVAAELLYAMDVAGLVKLDSFGVPFMDNGVLKNKAYPRVIFDERSEDTVKLLDQIKGVPTAIADAVLVERPDGISFGKPIENVPVNQMRNPLVKNTARQREAIKTAQSIPFYPNKIMIDLFQNIGEDGLFDLFGGIDLNNGQRNVNHATSIKGKNQSIKTSLRNLVGQLAQTEAHAKSAGVEAFDFPTYYPHNMSRVGRLHMQGASNPQADKIAREIYVSTRNVIDLTDPKQNDLFWMTVAQSLGVKTELKYRAEAIADAKKLVRVDYLPSMEVMQSYIAGGKITAAERQIIKDNFKGSISVKALHALIAVAQAETTKTPTEFMYSLALEADGKTDGPINAIMNFTAGAFTQDWVSNMEKGGLYLGSKAKTLNDYFHQVGAKDLYETATDALATNLRGLRTQLKGDSLKHMGALMRVMNELSDGQVQLTADGLQLKRNVAKNPLTITVYGSGIDGIAGKVSGALIDEFYIQLSNKLASGEKVSDKLVNDLNLLMNSRMTKAEDGSYKVDTFKGSTGIDLSNYQTATFTSNQLQNFRNNTKLLFVEPMHSAIQEVMGASLETTQVVQRSIQVQSIVMESFFRKEVEARLAEMGKKKNDFLSKKQLAKIYKDLEQFSPLIETGEQSFFVGGSERSDIANVRAFGKSIDDKMQTPAFVFGPTNAGVGGIPYMVIGTGDGQMVQNILTSANAPKDALYVFDGVELKALSFEEDSRVINQAVYDAWMRNPVQDISNSFAAFLRSDPMSNLDEQTKLELKKAVFGKAEANGETDEKLFAEIASLNTKLTDNALQIEARKRALDKFGLSVDHMASAEAPYVHSGQDIPENINDMLTALNTEYEKELASLKGNQAQSAVEKPNAEFVSSVQNAGYQDADSGAYVLKVQDLPEVGMIPELAKALQDQDYTVVVGSSSEIAAYEAVNNPDTFNPNEVSFYGKHDPSTKTIYVSSITAETIAHELIHAATFNKVNSFYENDGTLSDEDTAAITRLDGLMREWVAQSYDHEARPAQEARQIAYSQVAQAVDRGNMAVALNEFMAWSLSNKAIADVQKKTKVLNPAFRILGKALAAIKALIWGKNIPAPTDKLYSNLEFNTRILLATPTNPTQTLLDTVQYQSKAFGSNDRITELRSQFAQKLASALGEPNTIENKVAKSREQKSMLAAQAVANEFQVRGFKMNLQEASTFTMIHAALATEAKLNPSALVRIQDIYADTMQKLSKSTELTGDQYNVLNGLYIQKNDADGRSNLLNAFLALSMVSDDFRKILSKMQVPKSLADTSEGTVDRYLTDKAQQAMDSLTNYMSGEGKSENVTAALDALTETLVNNAKDQRSFFEKITEQTIGRGDQYLADALQNISGKVAAKAKQVRDTTNNPVIKTLASFTRIMSGIVNNETAESISSGVTSAMNQMGVNVSVREFLAEIVGRTKENASVFDMVSKVRAAVQQTRQQFREQLPENIAKQFSRPLQDAEWTALFKGLGKTDASSLRSVYDEDTVLRMFNDDAFLSKEIGALENSLKASEKGLFNKIQTKSLELAVFMNTGKVSHNLLRNANAIANLYGEGNRSAPASDKVISDIDHLVSLYAIRDLDSNSKKLMSNLSQKEKNGTGFALSYLMGQRSDEQSRVNSGATIANHYKGFIPSEVQTGTQFLVADDSEYTNLIARGFIRVGDYVGSKAENLATKKGYYQSPVSGRASFNQGVLQTVRPTASGVDVKTGRTTQDLTAGFIQDPNEVDRIKKSFARNVNAKEPLMPIYNENGEIVAFERSLDPAMLANVNRNTHLGQMIGAWRGRQVEEAMATEFNHVLVNNLHKIWTEEKSTRSNEYIDLTKLRRTDDAVYHDAWSLIAPDTREYIKSVFGGDGFRVRKDMLNDAVGYRSASVGDAWTGTSRWNENIQKNFQQTAMGIFGNDAYRYFVNAEKIIQNVVTDAKVLIVVKSVIVPMANLISNGYQLLNRGIPARNVFKGMSAKTVEINQYIKNRDRQIEIEAELRSAKASMKDARKVLRLEAELQSIKDSNKRMTIADLVEAGEFASITEGGVTQEDLALSEGKFANLVEKLTDALPDGLQTVGKYALVTKDTALFKGLGRAVQYGDFIAKAVFYDDLRNRKGLSKEEALGLVSEEFVNYNRLAGRSRQYLESIGMLWFWNFKIRSIKIARSMAINNPLRSLMTAMSPGLPLIGDVGSPVTDNFLAVLGNGKLGYSIGPMQGLNSFNLNPWVNLMK